MENKRTFHIIGAGISGLYAAHLLRQKYPLSRINVYEAAGQPGGRCFSFYDKSLGIKIDNATHVLLRANRQALDFIGKASCTHKIKFMSLKDGRIKPPFYYLNEAALAIFNTPRKDVPLISQCYAAGKLFPFLPYKTNAFFSSGNLNEKLITPLLHAADNICFNMILKGFESNDGIIKKLNFNSENIDVSAGDTVVSALDSYAYNRIFGNADFEYNRITNIVFRTSMQITLPQNLKMLGVTGGLSQWIFSTPQFLAVTISNACPFEDKGETARRIWQEIGEIRGNHPAFMPAYKILTYPRATICQNKLNNAKRPVSAKTAYKNLFICGDWTMKSRPCCIETAFLSALRAVNLINSD